MENLITPVKRIALVAKLFYSHNIKKICNRSVEAKLMEENKIETFSTREEAKKEIQFVPFSPFPFQVKWGEFSRFKVGKKIGSPEEEKKVLLLRNMPKKRLYFTERMGRREMHVPSSPFDSQKYGGLVLC